MTRPDNYAIQAAQARQAFTRYDHAALAAKLGTSLEDGYLHTKMLGSAYRICLQTGDIQRQKGGLWTSANTFGESMVLLDLVCDSAPARHPSGRWKNLQAFGQQFHRSLLETQKDPDAEFFARHRDRFAAACEALGGKRLPQGDVGYAIPFFEDLCTGIQLWLGDDEFPNGLKYMWDENALQYLKYETMHFARGLLLGRIRETMEEL